MDFISFSIMSALIIQLDNVFKFSSMLKYNALFVYNR